MAPPTRNRKLLKHDEIEDSALAGSDMEQDATTSLLSLIKRSGDKNPRTKPSQDDEALLPVKTSAAYSRSASKAKINAEDARRNLEDMARNLKAQIKTGIVCHESSLGQLPTIKEFMTKNIPDNMPSILPHTYSSYPGQTSKIANDPYRKATRTLDGFRGLLKDYEELSIYEGDIKMPAWARWKQDGTDLQLLNASLMGHSMKYVEKEILPNVSRTPPNNGNDDIDRIASELLQETWRQKPDETWGDATEGILQTVLGLATILP